MAQRRRGGIRGNRMDVGEGVEANPPVGRNVGLNQNIEREDMIAELRRQVAAFMEVVQRMQPPHETTDESDDSHSHFENPFGAHPRGWPYVERNEPRLDYNFKVEIPEFQGSLKPEDFVDWFNTVERVFDYYEVIDEKKVKLVAICLKRRDSSWWEQLQISRQRIGKVKIKSWEKMKKKLCEQFLPFNYTQSLYKDLHNLKQEGSVEEYMEAFHQLVVRVD